MRRIVLKNEIIDYLKILLLSVSMFLASYQNSVLFFIMFSAIFITCILKKEIILTLLFIALTVPTFFTIPNTIAENTGFGRLITIVVIVIGLMEIINKKINFAVLLIFSTIMTINLFSYFYSYAPHSTIHWTSIMALNLFTFLVVSNMKICWKLLLKYVSFSSLVIVFLFSYVYFTDLNNFYGIGITISEGIDKNRFGMGLVLLAIICLINMIYNSKIIIFVLFSSGYLLTMIMLIFSGSRTATIATILASLIFIFFAIRRLPIKKRIAIILFLTISVFIIYFVLVNSHFYQEVFKRYSLSLLIEDKAAFRFIAWYNNFVYIIPNNFFFGTGLSSITEINAQKAFGCLENPAHNIFISLFTQLGLIGVIVYFVSFFYVFRKTLKRIYNRIESVFFIFLLVGAMLNGIGEVIFTTRTFWLILGFCLGSALYVERQKITNWQIFV